MNEYISLDTAEEAVWEILNGMGYSQKHNERLVEEVRAVLEEYASLGETDEPNDSDLEMGFDPYLGCYTDDC